MFKNYHKRFKIKITTIISLTLFISSIITVGIYVIFQTLMPNLDDLSAIGFLGVALITSNIGSSFLSLLLTKSFTDSLDEVTTTVNEVANGNFKVRLNEPKFEALKSVYIDFNKMVKELESTTTLRNDFIYTFSHEYKTPIVSIKGFAELLLNENLSLEEQKEYLKIIYDESSRLSKLAQNVLFVSKLEGMDQITEQITFRLDEQIRQTALLLYNEWDSKKINLDLDLDNINYFGNESLVKQMWLNLLNNAIRFTNENGNIKITLKEEEENIVFTIVDDGVGMDQETQIHLFDKFYQGENNKSTGNGLGLTIVKKIVLLLKGEIEVKSEINEGTAFKIILKK